MFHRRYKGRHKGKRRAHVRVGLRTLKTALAVGLALYVVSLFGEISIFPALAAIAVMSPTFEDALRECKSQGVGILIGGVLGCTAVKLWPGCPIWFMGLGVVLILSFCAARHLEYAGALSCCIFLAACVGASETVIMDTVQRLLHTATGLAVGLGVNTLILPYDNRPRILQLLRQACDEVPAELGECILNHHYPDMNECETLIARLHYELRIYSHQLLDGRNDRTAETAYLTGCVQLAERMVQELYAISCMDTIGAPTGENCARLAAIGMPVSSAAADGQNADVVVANYHLGKLLDSRDYLMSMLDEAEHREV
ncbi:MAG: hypothetical protein IKM54_07020 [Butyricicoccus sp.]|nr:hypothetical protein [Butyricicoccus sp.]